MKIIVITTVKIFVPTVITITRDRISKINNNFDLFFIFIILVCNFVMLVSNFPVITVLYSFYNGKTGCFLLIVVVGSFSVVVFSRTTYRNNFVAILVCNNFLCYYSSYLHRFDRFYISIANQSIFECILYRKNDRKTTEQSVICDPVCLCITVSFGKRVVVWRFMRCDEESVVVWLVVV